MLTKKQQTSSNRIKPKPSMKNKKKITDEDVDLLDKSIVVRFDKIEMQKRNEFVSQLGPCQVCDESYDLDIPHHAKYGMGSKDDRYIVNICVKCHREVHSGSYDNLKKTRAEIEEIGWNNHKIYLDLLCLT